MIQLQILRWIDYPGLSGWALNALTNDLIRERKGRFDKEEKKHREDNVKMKAEIGLVRPPA